METETVIASFETLLAAQRVGTIQTDTFCAGCGYNLFSQGVVRDPNTAILLCRCPECGKFTPAGVATIADSGWRRAAGGLLIFLRAIVLLGLIVLALILMGVIPYALADEMISFVHYRLTYYDSVGWPRQILFTRVALSVCAAGVGLGAGLIAVVGFYHWRKRYYYLLCLAPLLVLLVIIGFWRLDHAPSAPVPGGPQFAPYLLLQPIGIRADTPEDFLLNDYRYSNLRQSRDRYEQQLATVPASQKPQWQARIDAIDKEMETQRQAAQLVFKDFRPLPSPAAHMGAMTLLAILGMLAGIVIGRPVVRGMLRVLLPARALQSAAVLWFADGKVPPHVRQQQAGEKVNG